MQLRCEVSIGETSTFLENSHNTHIQIVYFRHRCHLFRRFSAAMITYMTGKVKSSSPMPAILSMNWIVDVIFINGQNFGRSGNMQLFQAAFLPVGGKFTSRNCHIENCCMGGRSLKKACVGAYAPHARLFSGISSLPE
jgi:hypothetical protein